MKQARNVTKTASWQESAMTVQYLGAKWRDGGQLEGNELCTVAARYNPGGTHPVLRISREHGRLPPARRCPTSLRHSAQPPCSHSCRARSQGPGAGCGAPGGGPWRRQKVAKEVGRWRHTGGSSGVP